MMDNVPRELRGDEALYRIVASLGHGQAGFTYKAKVSQLLKDEAQLTLQQEVVIKVPRIEDSLALADKMVLYSKLATLAGAEYSTLRQLKGLECVATILDWGARLIELQSNVQMPAIFIVQDYIKGQPFPAALAQRYGSSGGFYGVPNGEEFFRWAVPLAQGLLRIHQRQVIHGDIWPANIMVRDDGKPVFIDFGQALFRDLVFDPSNTEGRNSAYIAPEYGRSVGGDIYSLGGVFFFLATGRHPFSPIEDIDQLKSAVVSIMKDTNPNLFRDNRGIADIIARSLRYSRHGRISHTAGLLEDIETFQRVRVAEPVASSCVRVDDLLQQVETQDNPFFAWIADLRTRSLAADIEDMSHGIYDLTGGHETLVSALTQYVSILGRGDKYLTISTSAFWLPQNMGLNGRFLAMNTLAAQSGVTLRRIFLVTRDELDGDSHLQKVLAFHIREMDELGQSGVQTNQCDISTGGYYTCFQIVERDYRENLIQQGKHFGLIIKGQCKIVMYPIYQKDGTLVTLQFRVGEKVIGPLEEAFAERLRTADPIEKLREMLEKRCVEI
jgi:serine/threonine protein kinase